MLFAVRIVAVILAFSLFYYVVGSFHLRETSDEQLADTIAVAEQNPVAEAAVEEIPTEQPEFSPPLPEVPNEEKLAESELASQVFYQKLAELEAAEPETAEHKEEPQPETQAAPVSLDEIYEEKLPEDVIVEDIEDSEVSAELLAEGYHIHHQDKNVKDMQIYPNYKPPYFGKKPVIAVVIDDMGVSQKRTKDITSLQAPLTASFLTYGRNLKEQIQNALAAGQEVMVHTPMQAHSNVDTAPDVLTVDMTIEEVKAGLNKMLDKFENVRGINNHMGSRLTEDFERMNAVMEVLKERDLFFLDSKTSAFSVAKKAARRNGVAFATRHVFLDNENKVEYINKQLEIAERIARRNGYAIAIGHPKTATYQALKEWLSKLEEKGLILLPLSQIVDVLHKSHI